MKRGREKVQVNGLMVRMDDDLWEQLVLHAEAEDRPRAVVVRMALRDYLEEVAR